MGPYSVAHPQNRLSPDETPTRIHIGNMSLLSIYYHDQIYVTSIHLYSVVISGLFLRETPEYPRMDGRDSGDIINYLSLLKEL